MRGFTKIKPSRNDESVLSFSDVGKSHQSRDFFNLENMYFNAIHENKILTKISEFTVIYFAHLKRSLNT